MSKFKVGDIVQGNGKETTGLLKVIKSNEKYFNGVVIFVGSYKHLKKGDLVRECLVNCFNKVNYINTPLFRKLEGINE